MPSFPRDGRTNRRCSFQAAFVLFLTAFSACTAPVRSIGIAAEDPQAAFIGLSSEALRLELLDGSFIGFYSRRFQPFHVRVTPGSHTAELSMHGIFHSLQNAGTKFSVKPGEFALLCDIYILDVFVKPVLPGTKNTDPLTGKWAILPLIRENGLLPINRISGDYYYHCSLWKSALDVRAGAANCSGLYQFKQALAGGASQDFRDPRGETIYQYVQRLNLPQFTAALKEKGFTAGSDRLPNSEYPAKKVDEDCF